MVEERSPEVMKIEAHEDFLQHVERGRARMRALSAITIVVTFLLIASYFSQLILPYITGTVIVQVNLRDPALVGTQILLMILAAVWLSVGVADYLFTRRLGRSIDEIRAAEKELEKRMAG